MRVRFGAPPTDYLGIGDARWAVLDWLMVRHGGGAFLLVIEDADTARGKPAWAAAIERDLRWLGISWDRLFRQSDRLACYAEAADALRRDGRLYPCFESPEELRAKHDRRVRRGQPTLYDRAMLHLTAAQRAAAEAGGKRPYWRFRLSGGAVRWRDRVLGGRAIDLGTLSDPVLVRADGVPQRLFADVVDDLDLGVSHALRNASHEAGTALELDLREALGGAPLTLAHLPPLAAPDQRLRRLRADGVEPDALALCLAAGETAAASLEDLARYFDAEHLAAAPTRLDMATLLGVNRRRLAAREFPDVAARLPPGADEGFWRAIRGSIDRLGEADLWWELVCGDLAQPATGVDPSLALYGAGGTAADAVVRRDVARLGRRRRGRP